MIKISQLPEIVKHKKTIGDIVLLDKQGLVDELNSVGVRGDDEIKMFQKNAEVNHV